MLDYRSIHAAATDKVVSLAGETAERGALESAFRDDSPRAKRSATLLWALRLMTH